MLKNYIKYFIFICLLFFSYTLNAKELKKVTIQLSWFDQFQFAGYYIAKEKGFYEDLGLDVSIKPFEFGIDIPKEVSDGTFDFAVGRETLILDKSNGRDIVALYALFQSTPLILVSTKESGINKIEDFKNKRVMTTIDDAGEVSLKAMIRSKNVRLEELEFLKHTHNINDLINKKTDVISAYLSKSPFELQQKGIEYNIFDPKSYGFDMYSDLLYTNSKLIKKDINTVLAFKEASLKGWRYAYSNIDESVDLVIEKYNAQNLKKEELLYEANELKKLSYFNTNELGNIKKEKIQRIFDLYNVMGLTQGKINFNDFVYTHKDLSHLDFNEYEKIYLNTKEEINICAMPNLMPYSKIQEAKLHGIAGDFIEILKEKIDLKFNLILSSSWDETLKFIKEKRCDVIPTIQISDMKKEFINFTNSYTQVSSVLITKDEKPFVDSLKNLKNKKIGITKGFSLKNELEKRYPKIRFIEVETLEEGLIQVENELLYAQLAPIGSAWYVLQFKDNNQLKISGKIDEKIDLRVGVRNDDGVLFSIVSKVVDTLDSKNIENLKSKWVYVEHKKEFDYVLLFQVLATIFILILLLLYRQYLLKESNKDLNKKVEEKTKELQKINETLESRIKEAVEENLRKDRLLARQSKMAAMGEMIENIAHQWRQPLSVISTSASGMKVKKDINDLDDKFFYDSIQSIMDSSNYLSHTIDDFRYFFKPEEEKDEFCIANTLDKTINLISSKLEQENIKIIRKMQEVKINGHETEFIQVFINILNNARDALQSSKENEKLIFINVDVSDEKVIVKIRDNAGGIKSKIMDKIFDPYFTTKHSSQGTGIGLYMCDQIISKYMNGVIEVKNKKFKYEDKEYKGAQFSVILYLNK